MGYLREEEEAEAFKLPYSSRVKDKEVAIKEAGAAGKVGLLEAKQVEVLEALDNTKEISKI
jgi:hypothetical protein